MLWLFCLALVAATSSLLADPPASCATALDCSLGGLCTNGLCACDPAFKGPNCSQLNLLPAPKTDLWNSGGRDNKASWGGNTVFDSADQKWHLFFAEFLNGCGLDQWQTNSAVSHAVADSPQGPYTKTGVVQPAFHHNPSVAYDPTTKTFLLVSIGNGSATPQQCGHGPSRQSPQLGDAPCAGIITLSHASTANGPWTTLEQPILDGRSGKWDFFVTNPSVHIYTNGSVLLAYRGGWAPWHVGLAVASSWRGPYTRLSEDPAFPVINEDPGLFLDQRGHLHMLTHYFGPDGPGGHAFSPDGGRSWRFAGQAYNFSLQYDDGTEITTTRRERPQVLSLHGKPAMLFTGIIQGDDRSWTQAQPISQD